MYTTALLAALKVLVLAGGGEASENHHSHKVHVERLMSLLADRGVPAGDVTLFWADGADPGPDRAVLSEALPADHWRIEGTRLDLDLAAEPTLVDTRFDPKLHAGPVRPARRDVLEGWLSEIGPTLTPDDTLLVAVTDHGEPDPAGGSATSISLWGESWTAPDFAEALKPVPTTTRVVLWMSQCFSGGFAELYRTRPNTCGAFSAHPDRPAYGCDPALAVRTDVGHFLRMVDGLAVSGNLSGAHDAVVLSDDTPDTPHLTSDVMLFDAIDTYAADRGADLSRVIDARLPGADDPGWAPLAALATRYGLGPIASYADVMDVLGNLTRARYELGTWLALWSEADLHARSLLAEPMLRVLRPARGAQTRRTQQIRAIAGVGQALRGASELAGRIRRLRAAVEEADAINVQIDLQEAAAIRAAYLLTRMAEPKVLSPEHRARYAALRACETAPLLPGRAAPESPVAIRTWPSVAAVPGRVAALRPGWLGITYRQAPRNKGAMVERFEAGSPAWATGLEPGDHITAVDGWTLSRRAGFREAALLARPGQRVPITVRRGRRSEEISIVAAPHPLPRPPPTIGQPVPPLALEPLGRDELLRVGEGRRVLLFFWETTCAPCRAALPALNVWAEAFGAQVIAVTGEPAPTVRRYVKRKPLGFPVAIDRAGEAARLFSVERRPVFVVIDATGRFRDEGEGYTDRIPLREPIDD